MQPPCHLASAPELERKDTPALAFILTHSSTKEHIIFDLGIRKDIDNLPTPLSQRFAKTFEEQEPVDIVDALEKGGVRAEEVKTVKFVVVADCRELFKPGWPTNPSSEFASDLLPPGRTEYLSPDDSSWVPLGPFSKAFDYFGDGSMYIVDAPGHLQGHINILVRTSSDGGWIYLAGDSAHDWRLLQGESVAEFHTPGGGHFCMHVDKAQAEDTIRRIAQLLTMPRVRVILAHDAEWYAENKGGPSFWPGTITSL